MESVCVRACHVMPCHATSWHAVSSCSVLSYHPVLSSCRAMSVVRVAASSACTHRRLGILGRRGAIRPARCITSTSIAHMRVLLSMRVRAPSLLVRACACICEPPPLRARADTCIHTDISRMHTCMHTWFVFVYVHRCRLVLVQAGVAARWLVYVFLELAHLGIRASACLCVYAYARICRKCAKHPMRARAAGHRLTRPHAPHTNGRPERPRIRASRSACPPASPTRARACVSTHAQEGAV